MRLGILQADEVSEDLIERFGRFPAMYEDMFWQVDATIPFATWPVMDDDFPETPTDRDGWIVTGSRHGVYDDLPWMEPLKAFLRDARSAGVPVIGICFGHQIMAEAFGGRAENAAEGWCAGVQTYEVRHRPSWMASAPESFRMHAMHQDKVTALAPDATVLASSAPNPYAMLAYGDPERPDAISIQPHPEFDHEYIEALLDLRQTVMAPDINKRARESLHGTTDSAEFPRWALSFLETRLGRRETMPSA